MLRILFRIIFIIILLLVIRALFRSLFSGPTSKKPTPSPESSGRTLSGHMEKDPICGMYIDTQTALSAVRDGKTAYFCSEECRKKFLALPAR